MSSPRLHEILRLLAEQLDHELWLTGGAVRNTVWDSLHVNRPDVPPTGDVDVIWFDPNRLNSVFDAELEYRLAAAMPDVRWDVKNQARMPGAKRAGAHNLEEAMKVWPETASAVAVRLASGRLITLAPFGLDDLFALRLRRPKDGDPSRFEQRVGEKRWLQTWPLLVVDENDRSGGTND